MWFDVIQLRFAAQPAVAADLACGLESSLVYSSVGDNYTEPSLAHPAKRLMRQPLGRLRRIQQTVF